MKRMLSLCAAALCLTMALAPTALAADFETAPPNAKVCYPTSIVRSDDGTELKKIYDLGPEDDPAGIPRSDFQKDGFQYTLTDLLKQELPENESRQHTETVTLQSKKKDNMVIQETLQWMAERQQYAEAVARTPAEPETPERSAPTESTPTAFPALENTKAPPSSRASESTGASAGASQPDSTDLPPSDGERPVYTPPQSDVQNRAAGSTYDPPTVGEVVVRMLHHMSRIFEDNSRTDRIHRGLQIDRKRRQELQRKRLAMGHKADDHEEQSLSSLR